MIEIIPNWHPALVHFPIVFVTAAVFFTTLGKVLNGRSCAPQCLMTGRWMLWGAAVFAVIAAVLGWFAYSSVAHDEASHAAMTVHRNWALGAMAALIYLAAWNFWRVRSARLPSGGYLVLLVMAWLLVISTAWHGGELVYRYGLGVAALPDVHDEQDDSTYGASEHEHAHSH